MSDESFSKTLFARWQAINESSLPSEEKDTLRALLFYLRDRDECWPGLDLLASDLSIKARAVRRRLARLESLGVIHREQGQNQRLIRANWESLDGGNLPDRAVAHDRVEDDEPGRPRQGGRSSTTANPVVHDHKPGRPRPPKRTRREQEESIEENRAHAGKSSDSKSPKFDPLKVAFPESIDTPEIRSAWADWAATRRESRKPLTRTSAKLAMGKLSRAGPTAALEALRESAANGWQGVFPEKYKTNGKGGRNGHSRGLQGAVYDPERPEPSF